MVCPSDKSVYRELLGILMLLAGAVISGCTAEGSSAGKLDKALAKQFSVAVLDQAPTAPDFTLNSLAGESISLSDYRGKIVLLNFSASW